ncbi:GNAT family N-acetyltransferase [Sphingosinicellaceae bacterium]|nr:GNAT family N-acetyltransferase [Sphingosinicellaceae bacterium]
MTATYRDGTVDDAAAVRAVYIESFDGMFRHLYAAEDYNAFIAGQGEETFRGQLGDPAYAFRLAEDDGRLVGFCKLGPPSLPYDPVGRGCIELRQLYLLEAAKGTGIGVVLMDWALAEARRRGNAELWLSVFGDNHRARRLYARYGFEEVRPFKFMVGNHADDELLCRLKLDG